MTYGKFISIEGIEGAGKSSVVAFIKSFLTTHHKVPLLTREPGGTPIAENMRQILLQAQTETLDSNTELLLMFACRAQHIKECIQPALSRGQWVVSDRFIDASYAYQGGGRNIPEHYIDFLEKWIVGSCQPHLTLLLDVDIEVGLNRTRQRGQALDRIEQEEYDFFQRVRDAYLKRAAKDTQRIKIINANLSVEEVRTSIAQILRDFLKENRDRL